MRKRLPGLLLLVVAGITLAQAPVKPAGRPPMKQEERQRMREDMRVVNRGQQVERQRQATPAEREKLRQDVREANQHLRR